jgi:hypothetical protein
MSSPYKGMSPNTIKLRYLGKVTFDLVDSLLLIVLKRLEEIEEDVNLRKKVYSIIMECSQNLCIHVDAQSSHKIYDIGCVSISVRKKLDGYKITSGNFISNERVSHLRETLDEVNKNATPEGLKKLYNKVLTNNNYSTKGGGGLGLIDIARRSNHKLEYTIDPIDDKYSFFKLKVSIKKNSK